MKSYGISKLSEMGSEWLDCTLADACQSIDYGLTASASNSLIGPKFLRITDIVSGPPEWNSVPNVPVENDVAEKYRLFDGDIVLARTGASTGVSSYIKSPPKSVFASYLVRLRIKSDFDARFISYYLKSRNFLDYIHGVLGDKSAQPNASASTMVAAPLRCPRDKAEQRRIAHILGALDDKIELNRRMNETLEEMARAVFKDWFVDFGSVRAKMAGRDAYLPDEVWRLFPDRLVESELGEVPEGWEVRNLEDFVDVSGGTTPSTKVADYWEGGTHNWATPKDLSTLLSPVLLETERKITDSGLGKIGSGLHPPGTVLLSSRAPVGYLAVSEVPVAVNQGFIAMQPRSEVSNLFMLFWCETFHEVIINNANGSTFLEITKTNFRRIPAVMPPTTLMRAFDERIRPIYQSMVVNVRKSRTLAQQRDALLPGLVSGALRIVKPT